MRFLRRSVALFLFASTVSGADSAKSPPPNDSCLDKVDDAIYGPHGITPRMQSLPSPSRNISNGDNNWDEEIDSIFGGWANKHKIRAMKALAKDDNAQGQRMNTRNYLLGLLMSSTAMECKDNYNKTHKALGKSMNDLPKSKPNDDNDKFWRSNFGDPLSDDTEGVVYANYAPDTDCAVQDKDDEVHTNRIPRKKNPCMSKFIKVRLRF